MNHIPTQPFVVSFRSQPDVSPVLSTLFASVLAVAAALGQQPGDSPVKVFILAGQSNMVGRGAISPDTTPGTLENIVANDPGGERQFLVDGGGDWVVRDDVWISFGSSRGGLDPGYGPGGTSIGPELGFGHVIGDLNENQVLLIKVAYGGRSLGNDFLPPSSGSTPATAADGEPGYYYQRILDVVSDVTTNLASDFPDYDAAGGYEFAGFFWHQGWNDRISGTFSAAYDTNMANFIKDMRSDLGAPNLPFVIATTGMDGSSTYTEVELQQLKMANTTLYPEFDGNVAVVDTRGGYEGLTFWRPPHLSPKNEGYHWNQNAETYLNIGLAGADAMSVLAPGRCPFRPRAEGGPAGVTVSWQNGTEIPTSVRILRDGSELAAAHPGDTPSFLDTTAVPGMHTYQLVFAMPGDPCDPLTLEFNGGITELTVDKQPAELVLHWRNNMSYPGIEVRRDGSLLDTLPGTATSYTDSSPPGTGLVTYSLVPTTGSSTPATVDVDFDIAGQLGVLDLGANGGINPATGSAWKIGDSYRLVFRTSTTTTADSPDIATYNAFVQGVAAASTTHPKLGDAAWKAIGSTATVNAKLNTGTDAEAEVPVYLIDGSTVFAYSNADIWNGLNPGGAGGYITINMDENGGTNLTGEVWTGSNNNGTANSSRYLGSTEDPSGSSFLVANGNTNTSSLAWLSSYSRRASSLKPMYAMSGLLSVVDGSDTTAPTLQSIVDDVSGGPVITNQPVTYTVTFSEGLMAGTVGAGDFENASSAAVTIDSVSPTGDPAVFEVVVTPTGTGDLQLAIASGAIVKDLPGNTLDPGTTTPDDTIITVNADTAAPTLLFIADDVSGGRVTANYDHVTYTVTFSEAMNAATIGTDDFENGASAPVTIDSVSATGDPAVFEVVVAPTGAGTLQLQVAAGAVLEDLFTNPLLTIAPLADETIITVDPPPAVASELGVLDVTANGGINPATGSDWQPGDTYRLVFMTSTTTTASSADIGTYNAFVQGVAAASTAYTNLGNATWNAVGSTETVNAQVNTGTDGTGTEAVFLIDGTTVFATSHADIWNGLNSDGAGGYLTVNLDENGETSGGDVWTGSNADGTRQTSRYLGNTDPANASGTGYLVTNGIIATTSRNWLVNYNRRSTSGKPMLAISEPLTIVSTSAGSSYSTWASVPAPGQDPGDDYDLDGVTNALEFVLGGTAATNDLDKLQTVATTPGGDMTSTFLRDQQSIEATTSVTIEVSPDLDDWSTSYPVPAVAAANNPGVTVVKGSPSGFDTVTLTLPMDSARKFARLKVTVAP